MRNVRRRRGFTIIELLVVTAIISVMIALLLPGILESRRAAQKSQCANNLRQIGLAMQMYHTDHNVLPMALVLHEKPWVQEFGTVVAAEGAGTGWGWSAFILPYIDHAPVYNQINFSVRIPRTANEAVVAIPIPIALCPSDFQPAVRPWGTPNEPLYVEKHATTSYAVSSGPFSPLGGQKNAFHRDNSSGRWRDFTDGLSNTIIAGEIAYRPELDRSGLIPYWRDFNGRWYGDYWPTKDTPTGKSILPLMRYARLGLNLHETLLGETRNSFVSAHLGGVQFLFADGSVRFINQNIENTETTWPEFLANPQSLGMYQRLHCVGCDLVKEY